MTTESKHLQATQRNQTLIIHQNDELAASNAAWIASTLSVELKARQ